MTVQYLLDTDTVIDVLRGRYGVGERLASLSPDDVAIASMTLAELLYGARCANDPARSEEAVWRFVDVVRILPFGRAAASNHSELRLATRHKTVGPNDLVIAAVAAAAKATVVTSNRREFERIPNLAVEGWRR